jgi:hypothetical protein
MYWKTNVFVALVAIMAPVAFAQTFTAKRSSNYNANSRNGRFDLRVWVNGPTECEIRHDTVRCRTRGQADTPRDAGCEYNREVPTGELAGLKLEQRDGRTTMQIIQEPSASNNYAIVVSIDDRYKRGDDGRHHGRITWDDFRAAAETAVPTTGGRRGARAGSSARTGGRVPDWAVGRFRGFNFESREEYEIEITSNGAITLSHRGRTLRGNYSGGRDIEIERDRLVIDQEHDGFRIENTGSQPGVIVFRRTGGSGGSGLFQRPQ